MKIIEGVGNMASSCFETACQFTIGQFFVRMLDHTVGIVEKTARWSLPHHEVNSEGNGKSFKSMELVRPLPWILFLPSLVILRGFRFAWNVGAFVIGYPEIHPSDIVKFLQKVRRRLHCIRIKATKQMRMKATQNTKTPGSNDETAIESTTMNKQHEVAKRKYSEVSSDDVTSSEESESDEMSFNTKLSHYALNSSTDPDDPDFTSQNCTVESNVVEESFETEEECDKLLEEAQEILTDDCTKTNHETWDEHTNANVHTHLTIEKKETAKNGNGSCTTKNLDEIQDCYSPCSYKSIEETDTTFFSPISSKSTSPERELIADDIGSVLNKPTIKEVNTSESSKVIAKETMDINHAENNKKLIEKNDYEEIESSNIRGKQQHENLKGKRGSHGNRKKK